MKRNNNINNEIIFQTQSCIIHIPGTPPKYGLIKKVSDSFEQIFGYKKDEVVNQMSINQIMPTLFADKHDEYIKLFLTEEKKNKVLY